MLDHFDPVDTRFRRIDLQLDTVDQRLASPVLNMRSPQIIEVNVSDLAILGRIVDQAVKAAQARRNTLVGFYNNVILPQLCDAAMRSKDMVPYRERVVGGAEGRVLEIGIGSELNLPFYRNVREIIGLEPAPRLIAMARRAAESISTPVKFIEGSAVAVPIEDRSIDTVLTTWTLCTIPDAARALSEMRRVLSLRADSCLSSTASPRRRVSEHGKTG